MESISNEIFLCTDKKKAFQFFIELKVQQNTAHNKTIIETN